MKKRELINFQETSLLDGFGHVGSFDGHATQFMQILILIFLQTRFMFATQVSINQKDAVVWGQSQVITGRATGVTTNAAVLYLNGAQHPFTLQYPGNTFSVPIWVGRGMNNIVVGVDSAGQLFFSDTLHLALGYNPVPDLYAFATVSGREITLHSIVVSNPDTAIITYRWTQDSDNPEQVDLGTITDTSVTFSLPQNAPQGEYHFTLTGYTNMNDTMTARTYFTVGASGIRPFDIYTDHAAWIDSSVVYGITPYIFVFEGRFSDITNKIPEVASLGVNTIWVQPVYDTHDGGQGYDVTDYFAVRPDLGTPSDLHMLVNTAHHYGLRVIFDFVPNHTSIYHPYAQDAVKYGQDSHYYDFYERQKDSAPYSNNEHLTTMGKMQFVCYFWNELVNLNLDNPEVRNYIIQAAEYWIKEYDIDGYRFDSAWAVDARDPGFMDTLRLALKRIKPSVMLLGEAKASDPATFDVDGFDVAYDWTSSTSWISQWVFATSYSTNSNPTIFNNSNQNARASLLHNALTNYGHGYSARAKIFRFIENNDTYRFLPTHDLPRTKMAAALEFSLPGIPLIYNGQEIGSPGYPYTSSYIFSRSMSIQSRDNYGLFTYYQDLSHIRTELPALYGNNFQELSVSPNAYVYAYRRWKGDQNVFGLINMGDASVSATVQLPLDSLHLDSSKIYYLSDLLTDRHFPVTASGLSSYNISVDPYTTRLLILADSEVTLEVRSSIASLLPNEFGLEQNYPNPFNSSTVIGFNLPHTDNAILQVYDVLGRHVETLVNGPEAAGQHAVVFNGDRLCSGVYFCVLQYGGLQQVRRMLLLK